MQKQVEQAKKDVCSILSWSELDYCTYQYESGMMYLQAKYNDNIVKYLSEKAIFWKYWRLKWFSRDEQFIARVKEIETKRRHIHLHTLRDLYECQHDIAITLQDVRVKKVLI